MAPDKRGVNFSEGKSHMQADEIPQGAEQPGSAGAPPVTGPAVGSQDREANKDARTWAMICHLAGFAYFVIPGVGAILGPLVVWLLKKQEFPFVDDQGKESVNFQITMLIYALVSFALLFVCIGGFLLLGVGVADIVLMIIAAIKANDGYSYRYPKPFIIRFIK